jgi:hypothetical protein
VTCAPDCGSSYNACGSTCAAGYHPTAYGCNLSCFSNNAVTCAVNGTQFTQCGTSCPAGYVVVSTGCNLSCSSSCFSNNSATCKKV